MKRLLAAAACAFFCSTASFAADCEYNDPAGDAQYKSCVDKYKADKAYTGGEEPGKCGQTKVESFCRCAWNETPSESKDLYKALEGAENKLVALCEKWSGWK